MRKKLIKNLSLGYTLPEISEMFKNKNIKPNSLSSIEKEINKLKKEYNAKTMFQLGFILSKLNV